MLSIRSISLGLVVLSCVPCWAQAGPNSAFSMLQKTTVPGGILPSGEYTIKIVDHLSDRSIVQITSPGKSSAFTFLGVGAPSTTFGSVSGPIFWNKGLHGTKSLRGFSFPTGERLEFVYPKGDAVALATANKEGVVAVDPGSEERPELSKLSPADLELVTLWSLTPVTVGPESASDKGIEAKRYVPEANQRPQINASSPSSASSALHSTTSQASLIATLEKPSLAVKVNRSGPYVKRLPQTAGYTPLVGILALLSLCGALCLRLRSTL
jgi:hypothetical protein